MSMFIVNLMFKLCMLFLINEDNPHCARHVKLFISHVK